METTDAFEGLECRDCGAVHDATTAGQCPECDGSLDPTYDYDAVDAAAVREVAAEPARGRGVGRFDALLPFPAAALPAAAEGGTPLVSADRLAGELGVGEVLIKDEARNPTGTFHDRGMCLAVAAASEHAASRDVEPLACATPGNSGQSMAAYAGRAGLRSYAFVPSRCAFSNKAMTNVHGGDMRVVGGRFPDAAAAVDEQLATEYTDLGAFTTPYRHEGAKTVAYEIAADRAWDVPDAVVVPTSTGELVVGIEKGFRELRELGLVDAVPSLVAAQPEGCAPVAAALDRGIEAPEPWETPDTICGELEIPDPAGGAAAVAAVRATGGRGVVASDDDILESAVTVAQNEVLEMGAAGGVAPAGAWVLGEADFFDADDEVVLINTEAGLKTPDVLRSHLMGKGI